MFYMVHEQLFPFLDGEKFHNGLVLNTPDKPGAKQLEALTVLLQGKSVIHVGCADHLSFIDQKRMAGTWMHDNLLKFTRRCLGVDINEQAVAYLTGKLGYKDIILHDLTSPSLPEEICSQKWDYLFMGDVLEHIDNPVEFLAKIHGLYKDRVGEIVVSVPNAFSFQNAYFILRCQECINTDHRYWFSVFTLAKVMVRAGFRPKMYATVTRSAFSVAPSVSLPQELLDLFVKENDTILMTATF